jgi:hypothetical protein
MLAGSSRGGERKRARDRVAMARLPLRHADAWTFSEAEQIFNDEARPPHVPRAFSHTKVDGLGIYVEMGSVGGGS